MDTPIHITDHAYQRMLERFGWSPEMGRHLAQQARTLGDQVGPNTWQTHARFVFKRNFLVTVLPPLHPKARQRLANA